MRCVTSYYGYHPGGGGGMGGELSKREGCFCVEFKAKGENAAVPLIDLPRLKHKSSYLCWISVLNVIL